ncbi:MAG TPA: ATP-binding protein, partial [Candidatus Methylomirabilis sp.]
EEMRLKPPYDRIEALRSRIFADVPLIAQGRPIGVLGVDRKYSRRPLEPATVELLQLFAGQAALAIENARLYEEQRLSAQHLESTVETRTRELQEAMRRVEQASRFKSEFLATMSHELRTPLNAIIGFSELLRDQQFGPLNDKQTRYVQNVWTSGKYLLQLINDILDLSKVEAGKLEIQPESLDLGEALHAALNQLRSLAEPKGLHMDLRMADGLALLTADPVRFNQILYNLLSNAVKFTPPGGKITLSARVQRATSNVQSSKSHDVGPWTSDEQTFVEISVEDTGIGIKAEDLPRLFQEFTQLDASLSRQHQGTGLGLALTKKLVELHGGRIWAESRGEGQGTTFTFTLPLKRPTAAPPVGKIRNTGNA